MLNGFSRRCALLEPLESRRLLASQLLPDLTPWANSAKGYLYDWSLDKTTMPGHTLLRLTAANANVGAGLMDLIGGAPNGDGTQQVEQRIYNTDGTFTDRLAGNFVYHPTHHHFHFEGFAEYDLLARPDDNSVGALKAGGAKTSFCLEDVDAFDKSLPGAPPAPVYVECSEVEQGISVGWADVYNYQLDGQWIDITGVPDGKYWLQVVDDPQNRLVESNEDNNTARIPIDLHLSDSTLATAYDVGKLEAPAAYDEFVGDADANDYYKFTLSTKADVKLNLGGLSGDADIKLLDSSGAQILKSSNGGNTADAIATTLNPGTYYAQVYAFNGNTTYHLSLSQTPVITPNVSYAKSGDAWNYLDTGVDPGTDWNSNGFDDSAWKSGKSQLGYGDGDEQTVIGFGSDPNNRFVTTYFRKSFDVTDASSITALQLQVLADDGGVVYLNGAEMVRSNLPAGPIANSTLANTNLGPPDESTFNVYQIDPAALKSGTNVIAVEVHQAAVNSVDLSFDLKLDAVDSTIAPAAAVAPSNLTAEAQSSSQIKLGWKDNATDNTGYVVERSTDGTKFTALPAIGDVNTFIDSGLSASKKYYYRVYATHGTVVSGFSNIVSATTQAPPNMSLIASGSTWKYLDNGSDQKTSWRNTTFSDSSWKSGKAQLGYGDGDEATVVKFGSSASKKFITTYFRQKFTVANPSQIATLAAQMIRDDGAVLYLNGHEVWRSNMPSGTVGYKTLASKDITGSAESTWQSATLSKSFLVSGTNVIAVEMHQHAANSPDLSFDFKLTGIPILSKAPVAAVALGSLFSKTPVHGSLLEVVN